MYFSMTGLNIDINVQYQLLEVNWSILASVHAVNVTSTFKDRGIDVLSHYHLPKDLLYLLYRFQVFHMSKEIPFIVSRIPAGENDPIYKGVNALDP